MDESKADTSQPVKAVKDVFLTMPTYNGTLTVGSARGLYRSTKSGNYRIQISCHSGSLLAANMNSLWCMALGLAAEGKCHYFAMLHDDIEPEEFWLDKLIPELETKALDVLGVVSPVKDVRGVTSIAMARPDGDNWTVHGRLTMKEVYRLPATFTSEDLGFLLLINTGLWVCKFNQEWARQVHFRINDRTVYDPKKGSQVQQVESEDWYVSRLFHKLGLRVGCTRIVELGHRGVMTFSNKLPWGEYDFDREYLARSVLDDRPPAE